MHGACYLHLHLLCYLLIHLHYQDINCHYVPWLYHQCLVRLKEHAQCQTIQHNCWSIQTHNQVKCSWLKDLPQQLSYTTSLCIMIFWFSPLAPVYMVETNTDQHFFRVATVFGKWNSRSFWEKSVLFSRRNKRTSNNMPPPPLRTGQQRKIWF